jgi:hypothetical protein
MSNDLHDPPRRRGLPLLETGAVVVQLAVVGAMVGSLVAFPASVQNEFVGGGAVVGAFIGWRAGQAQTKFGLFVASTIVGVGFGFALLGPLAVRLREPVLFLSGASLGVFLATPVFLVALPAFAARDRATRARDRSILRSADATATWAGSCAAIALLGLAGQPVVVFHERPVDLSVAFLALGALASWAVVVDDLRAWEQLRRRDLSLAGASAPRDVGVGADTFEERIPPSDPFRSAEKVNAVTVGDVSLARRALFRSLLWDAGMLVVSAVALGLRAKGG